jgi:hypothetical protein
MEHDLDFVDTETIHSLLDFYGIRYHEVTFDAVSNIKYNTFRMVVATAGVSVFLVSLVKLLFWI